jgi:hypothetical protein
MDFFPAIRLYARFFRRPKLFFFSVELINTRMFSIHHDCCNFPNPPMVLEIDFRAIWSGCVIILLLYFVIDAFLLEHVLLYKCWFLNQALFLISVCCEKQKLVFAFVGCLEVNRWDTGKATQQEASIFFFFFFWGNRRGLRPYKKLQSSEAFWMTLGAGIWDNGGIVVGLWQLLNGLFLNLPDALKMIFLYYSLSLHQANI